MRFELEAGVPDWSFEPPEGSTGIADCYALNVDGDSAWLVYYYDFDLFHIDAAGGLARWRADASGVRAMACDGERVLLVGRYGAGDLATLWKLGNDELRDWSRVLVLLEGSSSLDGQLSGRGPTLHAVKGARWFAGSLGDLRDARG